MMKVKLCKVQDCNKPASKLMGFTAKARIADAERIGFSFATTVLGMANLKCNKNIITTLVLLQDYTYFTLT